MLNLSQKIAFKSGDNFILKDADFSVQIGADQGTECAVPGFNCGSGYIPPHPTFKINCGKIKPCPYVLMTETKNNNSGFLSIETEQSCEKNDPPRCYFEFFRLFSDDEGCMKLKTPMGRYHCLKRFESSARPENKKLCDQLPVDIYALRWNCFYEYAVRYRDPAFCDKYPPNESSGRDRCLLKMAELFKEHAFCKKISASKEHSYMEQCLQIKK